MGVSTRFSRRFWDGDGWANVSSVIALYPTPFPRDVFEFAKEITPKFAELYDKVSEDDGFMRETLKEAALNDRVSGGGSGKFMGVA